MKKIIALGLLIVLQQVVYAQSSWKASSPNNAWQIVLNNDNGKLSYQVLSGNNTVIRPSALGVEEKTQSFDHLSFVKADTKKIDEQYTLQIGKQKKNHATANETSVQFKNKNGTLLQIDMRAYNDGVAFRYSFPQKNKTYTITNETTEFAIPTGGKVWMENYDLPSNYTPAYEGVYVNGMDIGTNAKDAGGWAFPAIFQTNDYWILLTESNLDGHYFGAHLQSDCTNGVYKIALPHQAEALGVGDSTATATTPFSTPWRTIILGKNVANIVESNLVYHLADANKVGDVSWVKPGRASWSWWSDHGSSKDFNKLKSFVDLAKDMGWEYSLVDANWNIMQGGNIKQLVDYANSKNIGLLFWYNSGGSHNKVTEQPRDIMSDPVKRKQEFKKLREWGVKGVKVDFFQSDKQNIIQLYIDIMKDAAAEHIMVNFHGCTLPRGWSRTYPNLMSMEAVRGAENYGWSNDFAQAAPELNNILTYTRNVVGPMDYTPVTFSDYACCPHTTTNAQELALSVLFETGILHFADKVSAYESLDSRIKTFLRNVPTTWDETKLLQGYPGKETVLARRNGSTWYIAAANGEKQQKDITVPLSFLSKGNYSASIFSDGNGARDIKVSEQSVTSGSTIPVNVLPNGGFIIVLTPAK